MKRLLVGIAAAIVTSAVWGASGLSAHAANIIDEWASVKMPAAPAVKPVTVDPKTTALLMLDFVPHDPYCGPKKPRCGATLPAMKQLLANARAHGAAVIFGIAGQFAASDIDKDVAPAGMSRRSSRSRTSS